MHTRRGRRRWVSILVLVAACMAASPAVVQARSAQVKLTVHKLRGAELLGRVAGSFEATAAVPEGARLVTFYLDGRMVGWATEHPYALRFDTRNFPKGAHRIEAVAYLADGAVAFSNAVSLDFRTYRWHLAVRQSMFVYAATLPALTAIAGLIVHRLLHIQPRLALLERKQPQ